jgi:hypothetical protein
MISADAPYKGKLVFICRRFERLERWTRVNLGLAQGPFKFSLKLLSNFELAQFIIERYARCKLLYSSHRIVFDVVARYYQFAGRRQKAKVYQRWLSRFPSSEAGERAPSARRDCSPVNTEYTVIPQVEVGKIYHGLS